MSEPFDFGMPEYQSWLDDEQASINGPLSPREQDLTRYAWLAASARLKESATAAERERCLCAIDSFRIGGGPTTPDSHHDRLIDTIAAAVIKGAGDDV